MKNILIFVDGQFYKQIAYTSKKKAFQHLNYFKRVGFIDVNTGDILTNATFELI